MTLGQRIRELRQARKLTQRQLAGMAGIDFTYLSKIENDRLEHMPSLQTIRDLARDLGADELELMDLANKVPPVLEAIARDKDALRFFRRATETVKSAEGWRDLLEYLERKHRTAQPPPEHRKPGGGKAKPGGPGEGGGERT